MSASTAELVRALLDRGAIDDARELVHASLGDSQGTARADLLLAQGQVLGHGGQHLQALALSVEASEIFQAAGLPARVCDALAQTAGTLRAVGDHDSALSTLEHAETLARRAGDGLRTARVLKQVGILASMLGRHQHALSCLEEACAVLAREGAADELRSTRLSLLNAHSRRLDELPDSPAVRAEAESQLQQWAALASEAAAAGQAKLAVMAWGNHAITLQPAGRHREATDALRALIPRYREFGMRPNEGLAHAELGRSHEALGEHAQALHHYREACGMLRQAGVQDDLMQALEGLSRCEALRGDDSAALAALRELRAIEEQRRDDQVRQALQQREMRTVLARLPQRSAAASARRVAQ